MSVYFDRHTTYKSTAEPTLEEELNGQEPLNEFGRALEELEVMAGKIVTVTERVDRTMRILYRDRNVKFRPIAIRPEKPQKSEVKSRRRASYTPPADHPWRTFTIGKAIPQYEKRKQTHVVG